MNYETAMEEIQVILNRLQSGDQGLESMREDVAKALSLITTCRKRLREIKGEIDQLLTEDEA